MIQEAQRNDGKEIVGVRDGDDGGVIVLLLVADAQNLDDVAQRRVVGMYTFITLTMSVPALAALNGLLVQRYASDPPEIPGFPQSPSVSVFIRPQADPRVPPLASLVLMCKKRADDVDASGVSSPFPFVRRESHITVPLKLSKEAAWSICTLLAAVGFAE